MKAIVAVDLNWGIGCGNELLQIIPEDMKFFKEKTLGKVVVMGRETFNSLPNQAPLKDRINIVLSRDESFNDDRLVICRSIEEVLELTSHYNSDDVYIIGGQSIYTQFLPYCSEVYVTEINEGYQADKYFPNLSESNLFKMTSCSEVKTFQGTEYRFTRYERFL